MANSLSIIVLILMGICIQIHPSESKDLNCSPNQIAWKNKSTNRIEACMDCPPCPPSQQYSIACGTEAYIGTEAKCMDCPSGMYSESLDTNPCVYCAICTNKKVLQNCTSHQKAICGRCIKGYFYNRHMSSCMPFSAQATVPTIPTNLPTTPPTTIPTTRPPTTPPTTTPITQPPTTPPTMATVPPSSLPTTTLTTTNFPTTVPVTHGDSLLSWAILAVMVLLFIVAVIYIMHKVRKHFFPNWRLWKGRPTCRRRYGFRNDEEEAITMIATSNEQLLKDFLYKNYHDADKLYKVLLEKRHATWDFERVASKWPDQIKEEDLLVIKNQIHVENGSPVKVLCEKLITEIPQITVRMFAVSLKDINKKAYEILEPRFIKPETVC